MQLPFVGLDRLTVDAVTAPVSSVLPRALMHSPTLTALADADAFSVYVVDDDVVTWTEDDCPPMLDLTVKPLPETAVTVPKAARKNPPRGPPDGIPEGAPDGVPDGIPDGPPDCERRPPNPLVQSPEVLMIRTVAASTGADVSGALDEPVEVESIDGVAITQAPTFTADLATDFSSVNFVDAVHVTAVWESVLWTCAVLPEIAAILPVAPGKRPDRDMPCCDPSFAVPAAGPPFEFVVELDPQPLTDSARVATVAARVRDFFMDVLLFGEVRDAVTRT